MTGSESSTDHLLRTALARLGLIQDAQSASTDALENILAKVEAIDGRLSKIENAMAWFEKSRAEPGRRV